MARVETGNFSNLDPELQRTFESKVVAPRNPTLIKSNNMSGRERITPSQYISSMMLSTEERLVATRHMKLPTIIELLDMSQVWYRVLLLNPVYLIDLGIGLDYIPHYEHPPCSSSVCYVISRPLDRRVAVLPNTVSSAITNKYWARAATLLNSPNFKISITYYII